MSKDGKKTGLRRFVVLGMMLATLAVLSGCNDPVRAKIVGTWKIEHADKVTRRVNQDEENQDASLDDLGERMKLIFYSSGSLETQTKMGKLQSQKQGSWQLIEFNPTESLMKIKCDLAGQQTEHEIEFVEDDLIRLSPPNMAGVRSKINFRRNK